MKFLSVSDAGVKTFAAILWLAASLAAAPCLDAYSVKSEDSLYTVAQVIDGDTLELSGGERVRLIGIDAPEARDNSKLYRDSLRSGQSAGAIIKAGKKAKNFIRKLINGKQVRLEYDVERRDKYGRTLAYVFIPTNIPGGAEYERPVNDGLGFLQDGVKFKETFVNATLVYEGCAQLMTIPPNLKYRELLQKLQKEAREAKRGLWNN